MLYETLSENIVRSDFTVISADNTVPTAREIRLQQEIHRRAPIAGIMIQVRAKVGTAGVAATANPDLMAAILKRVQVFRNGVKAASGTSRQTGTVRVVDIPGADLLFINNNTMGLDRKTLECVVTTLANNADTTFTYYLPFAHAQLNDPIHAACCLPVHLDDFNPELVIQLAAQSDLDVNAAPTLKLQNLSVKVTVIRADIPPADTAKILARGGFIDRNWIFREFQINSRQQWRFDIPSPGLYENLMIRQTSTTSAKADLTDANNLNWELQRSGVTRRQFDIGLLNTENDYSRQVFPSGANWQAYSVGEGFLDFLSGAPGNAESSLRSLFNANLADNNGQVAQLLANLDPVTGGVTTTAKLKLSGIAMLGDLSGWQNVLV
jgi:hypothetical protein